MKSKRLNVIIGLFLIMILSSCEDETNFSTLIRILNEAVGENCSSGGLKVETGADLNRNSTLDSSEVSTTEYFCFDYPETSEDIILGDSQYDFTAGEIYKATTDGFLSVQYYSATNYGSIDAKIYADYDLNPTTVVGIVTLVPGSTVIPIQTGKYWKVTDISYCDVIITWIPILG